MSSKVEIFRGLHNDPIPLRLPNAWDAGSARLFETLGVEAIATTSAGMAWALGYPDSRALPIEELVSVAVRIARTVTVPISLDIENGYSDQPEVVADNVLRLVDLGVAGINIEDGSDTTDLLASKIEAIRNAVVKTGADLFINARSDVFLANLVDESKLVSESIARGRLYANAGADGLFLPGLHRDLQIKAIVEGTSLPLNLMAWPGLANARDLGALGVRRLSAGSAIAQSLWGRADRLATEFLTEGESSLLAAEESMPYGRLQAVFGSTQNRPISRVPGRFRSSVDVSNRTSFCVL